MTITRYEITSTVIDVSFTVNDEPAHVVLDRKEYDCWKMRQRLDPGFHYFEAYMQDHNLHNTWRQYEGVIYSSRTAHFNSILSPTIERYENNH